jgi:hypothetical protein
VERVIEGGTGRAFPVLPDMTIQIKETERGMKPIIKIFFFFLATDLHRFRRLKFVVLILCAGFKGFTIGEDSLKGKYGINDPRNPKCPCHKYQKLADDEYKAILAQLNKNSKQIDNGEGIQNQPLPNNGSEISGAAVSGKDNIKKKRSSWGERFKTKKKMKKHTRWRKLKESFHHGFWKRHPNADSCFKWRK